MDKIKTVYKAKVYEEAGGWYVWHNGAYSPRLNTKHDAEENLKLHFDAAVEQFGSKYEVELILLD
jgi:hypothetical protein